MARKLTAEEKRQKRIVRLLEKGQTPWNSLRTSTIRSKLKSRFQLLRRLEEADSNGMIQCVTCDKWGKCIGDGMHGGHWIHGTSPSLLVRPNVNPQCAACNTYHSKSAAYDDWMQERYDEPILEMIRDAKKCKHEWTRAEMAALFLHWGEAVKQEKERLGIS